MTIWNPKIGERDGPLYRELANAIGLAIEEGKLRPGERLPTQRTLADSLGIALTTVTRGYAEAERRGLVRGEVGRGTFVRPRAGSETIEENGTAGQVDLRPNTLLPWPLAPELLDRMARCLTAADPQVLFTYGPHAGRHHHRDAGAAWIRKNGLDATSDQVLVTTGAQHGMAAVFATLTRAGDAVAVEELTYNGMRSLGHVLGIRLRPVELDAEGMVPDALETVLAEGDVKAIYCTATLQNPTAAVMSDARRREIARLADQYAVPIVDDDSYGFMLPDVPPLSTYTANSYYLIGTSKPLLPSLRVGFLRAPTAATDRLAAAIAATVYMTSPITAELVTDWLANGTAERIMSWKREQVGLRQGAVRRILSGSDYLSQPRSPHGWLRLPEPWTTQEFVHQAGQRGVHVSPADDFCVCRMAPHAVRICVGPTPSRAMLEEAVGKLAIMLAEGPDAGRVVV
jgi:DNA-binding transcriptional MocR family regulator